MRGWWGGGPRSRSSSSWPTTHRRQVGCSSRSRGSAARRWRQNSRRRASSSRGSGRSSRGPGPSCDRATVAAVDASAPTLARLRGLAISARGLRALTVVNATMLVLIVGTGATVRLTGSGLGCEHWPGCEPHHFQPKSFHSFIECGNRVFPFLTILLNLITWIAARRGLRRLPFAVFAGTLLQAPLGALTVH